MRLGVRVMWRMRLGGEIGGGRGIVVVVVWCGVVCYIVF